jgi:CRISPR/Cas system-associated endonuclease Cas3-HD
MGLAIKIYEAFKDDETKAKVLSEVVDELEHRIVPMEQISTKGDLEVTKLALKKDIEEVRLTLQKEIEIVRKEIAEVKSGIIKWVTGLLVIQTGVIVTIVALIR